MSVLNIAFSADRVAMLSDTLLYVDDRPVGLCDRKVHVAPSGRFAWSTRGLCRLGDSFDIAARQCATVDEAEVAALAWIEALTDADLNGTKGMDVTLTGWSPRAADLVVLQLDREPGKPIACRSYDRGVYLLPVAREMPALPATVTEAQMIRLALAQWKIRERRNRRLCIGGVMHLTTVKATGAEQRIVGTYPDYPVHAAEFGCPNAEAVAEFLAGETVAA